MHASMHGPRAARLVLSIAALAGAAFTARTSLADDVIDDPELASPHSAAPAAPQAPAPNPTTWHFTLRTRWGEDTHYSARPSLDMVEGTTIGVVEAEQRVSDTLMFSVGLRGRYAFADRRDGLARYELDAAPVSAFVDVTPASGYHVRAGYQEITLGRFDIFSATNILAVYDLRSGPVTMPEAAQIAQPALRFDFDKVRGLTIQAYYVPFFQPDLVTVYGSNYALLSPLDRDPASDAFRRALEQELGRSGVAGLSTSAFQALGPAPTLAEPQGALRATLHGTAGELSATVGTALERLPAITLSPQVISDLTNPATLSQTSTDLIAPGAIRVDYGRYEIASVDASLDAGPVQLGAEGAYMVHRTLMATRAGFTAPAGPTPMPSLTIPERVNMAHAGLRAELVEAAGWAAEVEGFLSAALADPTQPPPVAGVAEPALRWFSMDQGRFWHGVAGGVHFAPEALRLRLEIGAALFNGPSYLILPRAEWEAVHTLFLELGAVFVGGPVPPLAAAGSPSVSLGGLFGDVDQVFVGARWSP